MDYASVIPGVRKKEPSKAYGRGLIALDSIFEFQTSFAYREEKMTDYIIVISNKLNDICDFKAPNIPILPDVVNNEVVRNYLGNIKTIPVGVEKETLRVATVDLGNSFMYNITGEDITSNPEFISRLANCEKLCPQFHLSLQSGCDETLKRMNRHYTTDEYRTIVNNLRKEFKDCSITTDVMVGFAGETDDEFEKSLDFVHSIEFAKVHTFMYSRRKGTVGDKLPNQIDNSVKSIRSKKLIEVTDADRKKFLESQVGNTYSVLFERKKSEGYWEGYTMNYTPVHLYSDRELSDIIVDVKITKAFDEYCQGQLL